LAAANLSEKAAGENLDELAAAFVERIDQMLARGHNLHDPRYIGHQVPAPVPLAGLFDALGSVTNQVMAVYEMGPWATAVERAVVERLGQRIGWAAGSFAGLATHGGSLANLTALLTARNVMRNDSWERGLGDSIAPLLVVHADAHYCITRAAGILGLGTRNVVRAALDKDRKIDVERLDQQLSRLRRQGTPLIGVVACACSTPIGAFDRLADIADVCRRHKLWLHVDAAHGGAVCFSQRHRHLVDGLQDADSVVWDAHKMLFVPALCAFVFYRDRSHRFQTFRQDAPYLFDPSAPGLADFDSGLVTVECTKRAAVYGLWGIWSIFGAQLFADMVDVTFETARQFYELLQEAPDFEPLHVPECNIVVFRHLPDPIRRQSPQQIGQFQHLLRRHLIQSGEFYIVQNTLDGIGALRVAVCNPLTTEDHLRDLMSALRRHGKLILEG
jgi:L-2,4-diaminobutyrate decarboxylase